MLSKYMTIKQAQEIIPASKTKLQGLCRANKFFVSKRIGKQWFIQKQSFENWLNNSELYIDVS